MTPFRFHRFEGAARYEAGALTRLHPYAGHSNRIERPDQRIRARTPANEACSPDAMVSARGSAQSARTRKGLWKNTVSSRSRGPGPTIIQAIPTIKSRVVVRIVRVLSQEWCVMIWAVFERPASNVMACRRGHSPAVVGPPTEPLRGNAPASEGNRTSLVPDAKGRLSWRPPSTCGSNAGKGVIKNDDIEYVVATIDCLCETDKFQ